MTINMRRLLQAGVHFGHQTRYWSPSMAPYIFGRRNKIHIINLEKTLPMLDEAMNFLGSVASQGGRILFVGTKRQAGKQIRQAASECGSPYVDHRWLGGMLTNFKTVKNSIGRLKELETFMDSPESAKLSKKEVLSLDRERAKLDRTLSGIKNLDGLPDALFVIDIHYEKIAVREAAKLGIPVVAVVDSNCTPENIDYVIPGNDDSAKAIGLYLEAAAAAIKQAHAQRKLQSPLAADDEFVEVEETGKAMGFAEAFEAAGADRQGSDPAQESGPDLEKPAEDSIPRQVIRKKVVRRRSVEPGLQSVAASAADDTDAKQHTLPPPNLDKVEEILAEVTAGARSQNGAIRYMHEAGMKHQDIADRLEISFEKVREILLESASMLTRPVDPKAAPPPGDDLFA